MKLSSTEASSMVAVWSVSKVFVCWALFGGELSNPTMPSKPSSTTLFSAPGEGMDHTQPLGKSLQLFPASALG